MHIIDIHTVVPLLCGRPWGMHEVAAGAQKKELVFWFFLNILFLNIFRIAPGLPNVTECRDSCVQVSEVKKIRVGRSKNISILDFFFHTNIQRLK